MRKRPIILITLAVVGALMLVGAVLADDGATFVKNVSGTPDQETERANLLQMNFYVPMQNANGRLLIEGEDEATKYYVDYPGDDTQKVLSYTLGYAKPLVAVYIDALPEEHEEEEEEGIYSILSGAGFGAHDAYGTYSLDDGHTWKATNLSNSAALSSFTLENGEPYPGDAHNMTFAIADDKVLVGWISKYCDEGNPLYRFQPEDIVALQTTYGLPDLYVHDIWGVNGKQGSHNYVEEGFLDVGEIPYSCVWSARGQLISTTLTADGTPGYEIVWLEAERLTSGERDANRLEMAADKAAGFMMTWQEDPDGLRPGLGLGPGEGWSGAVVHQDTDLWYSFISMEHFDLVVDKGAEPVLTEAIPLAEFVAGIDDGSLTGQPIYAVPMAVPVRLTDNAKCMGNGNSPEYCYINFDDENPWLTELGDTLGELPEFTRSTDSTFCSETYSWTTPGDSTIVICIAEDGRYMSGRVGASRPRVNVQPYNSAFVVDDETDTTWYDGGIVIMGAEESKALGALELEEIDEIEIGKNMMYYTFDLANPSFVQQGGMLNWPAKDPATGETYPILTDEFGLQFYDTEIARRFSHMSQAPHQIGLSGVSAVLIVKQGILNQGGPADIFLRFPVADLEESFACDLDGDTLTEELCFPEGYNPYAYQNLRCDTWEFTDGSNPRYLEGYCTSVGTNISGVYAFCNGGDCGDFPYDGGTEFPKVTTWDQDVDNLDDESWENPWDVAKGHRGFIDGDFIMAIYAWAPNWKANSVGNDHYNLYQRRSFDGGLTWTTTPATLGGTGTETCENYLDDAKTVDCTTYLAGEFEKSRNLSQLTGNRETILDPRYTPTGGLKMLTAYDKYDLATTMGAPLPYPDDAVRDPSKYFVVYETGDNTTVEEGEAVPMDLFYARATMYGDFFDLEEKLNPQTNEIEYVFDHLENDPEWLSGEAANLSNAGGTFYYAIWNQWQEDAEENVSNSDAFMARAMWLPDDMELNLAPVAELLYVNKTLLSVAENDTLILAATAKGFGVDGDIEQVIWTLDSLNTVMDPVVIGTEKVLQMSTQQLIGQPGWTHTPGQPGWAQVGFQATDKGGRTSNTVTVNVLIFEQVHRLFMPTVLR